MICGTLAPTAAPYTGRNGMRRMDKVITHYSINCGAGADA